MNITTQKQFNEYTKCANNPRYFIENYVKLKSTSGTSDFNLNETQLLLLVDLVAEYSSTREVDRQKGTTSLNLAYILWKAIFVDNYSSLVLSMNESNNERCGDIFYHMYALIPCWMKPPIATSSDTRCHHLALSNGSNVRFSLSGSDDFRGLSFNGVYVDSELAKLSHKENLKNIVNEYIFELNDSTTRNNIANDVKNYILKTMTIQPITTSFPNKVVFEINVLDHKFKLDLDLL